jgi:hypothetical protein
MTADAPRFPVWDLHVRPQFRLIDRQHMLPLSLDLWDYESVKDRAEEILLRLEDGGMPTYDTGGPWPREWVEIFRRWIEGGYRRLVLLAPTAAGYQLRQTSAWELSAFVRVPGDGWRVWLDLVAVAPTEREYALTAEPGSDGGPGAEIRVRDRFRRDREERLVVHDADGRHEIPFPA